ncbi:MAG: disulfide bond formation protein B [Rhodospirillales bacterium]|nr:disulfide bond formation protein B [Rhodospirillales bacterium]
MFRALASATPLQRALGLTFLISLATVGTAMGLERWGGLVPCALCLAERWPWRLAAVIALMGILTPPRRAGLMGWVVVLILLAGVALSVVHVGVEWRLWPSPAPECQAPQFHAGTIAQRLASLPAKPSRACEDATYLIPGLPISMAMMNLLDSLAVAVGLAWFLIRQRGHRA